MNTIQECACRALDRYQRDTSRLPLVLVASSKDIEEVRNMISVSLPTEASSSSSVWKLQDGRIISAKKYDEDRPPGREFELAICNGGRILTDQECQDLKKWRTAASP